MQWISSANDYALKTLKRTKVAVIGDTTGYGTSSAKTAQELLEKAGVKPVYSVLIDPNKTDLTDEMIEGEGGRRRRRHALVGRHRPAGAAAQRARRHGLGRAGGGPSGADGARRSSRC